MGKRCLIGLMIVAMLAPALGAMAEPAAQIDIGYKMLPGLYASEGQFVCSPLSLRLALGMAMEGANGATRDQLLAALGKDAPIGLSALTQLKSANAAIVSPNVALLEDYLSVLTGQYSAQIAPMGDDVVSQVNEWVLASTDGMIAELLTEAPDPNTMLILLNALALDADWQVPFDPDSTRDGTFHAPTGDISVPFMHRSMGLDYLEQGGMQAVKLPYAGGQLEMVLILPEAGGLQAMLEALSQGGLDALGAFLPKDEVRLAMPKFALESSLTLKAAIQAMGVVDAFDGRADFSGMARNSDLFIDELMQVARMDVDEQGTKAAAATAVMVAAKGITMDSVQMTVDRPFVALVRDVGNGALVFAAVVEGL